MLSEFGAKLPISLGRYGQDHWQVVADNEK